MHRRRFKPIVVLTLAALLLISIIVPSIAGGPEGPGVWYELRLVQVERDTHGRWIVKPLAYGPTGYQGKPGMHVKLIQYKFGSIEQEPADAETGFYVETGKGARCVLIDRKENVWRFSGSGFVYFHSSTTSGSVKYSRQAEVNAIIADYFPAVSLKVVQNPSIYGDSIWCTVYNGRAVSGHLTFTQGQETITATFVTPIGVFEDTIPALTPTQFIPGSGYINWFYPGDDISEDYYGYQRTSETIATTGIDIGPIQPSLPGSIYTVGFRATHPAL